MIYTVTFNPSLDYFAKVDNLRLGFVNRVSSDWMTVGGKGINVSLALLNLGEDTTALGFCGGFTGKAIIDRMNQLGLKNTFFETKGETRICVKIKGNTETDINGIGPAVSQKDINKLSRTLSSLLKQGDWLVLSGSVASSLNNKTYYNLLKKLNTDGIKVVVDATKELLTNTLPLHPFLIKPNLQELCEIFEFNKTVPSTQQIIEMGKKLQKMGARNVIISMGGAGAVMITEDNNSMYVRAASGIAINSVGAGDSMIAGFIHKYIETGSIFASLNYSVATGSACAFTKGHATKEQIEYVESLML